MADLQQKACFLADVAIEVLATLIPPSLPIATVPTSLSILRSDDSPGRSHGNSLSQTRPFQRAVLLFPLKNVDSSLCG